MIKTFIPEQPYFLKHEDEEDPLQLGYAYVTYHIMLNRDLMGQTVTLSLLDRDGFNSWPMICGSIIATGDDVVFLHIETINELVRLRYMECNGVAPCGSTLPSFMLQMVPDGRNGHQPDDPADEEWTLIADAKGKA